MEKKKCEICGQIKPQNEFSKSYKHRCKACVAEAARNDRKRFKELENACAEALKGSGTHIPVGAGAKSAPPVDENALLCMAVAFMQGMLSNPNLVNTQTLNADSVVVLTRNSIRFAKAFIKIFEKEGND